MEPQGGNGNPDALPRKGRIRTMVKDRADRRDPEMCPSRCRLFRNRDMSLEEKLRGYCDLAGECTWCDGDLLHCERSETLRDYVLLKMPKNTARVK